MYNIHRLQDIQYKDNKKDQGGGGLQRVFKNRRIAKKHLAINFSFTYKEIWNFQQEKRDQQFDGQKNSLMYGLHLDMLVFSLNFIL